MLKISDIMTRSPVAIPGDASVRDALMLLETMEIRHLPVVDAQGMLVGLVSERDLHSLYAPREELAGNWAEQARKKLNEPVTASMIKRPLVVEDNAPLEMALQKMIMRGVSTLPVVQGGRLVGMVSYVDLLRVMAKQRASEAAFAG